MTSPPFSEEQIPDLGGQIVVVTGPSSGLGFETCRALAARHATVVMAGRSPERCEAARARILASVPEARLEVARLDLADLGSVRDFAARFSARHPRLDVLCNNAGVMAMPLTRTVDGFELQLGTNHFGHFSLTGRLLERLLAAPAARVVTVTSPWHRRGQLRFDDLDAHGRYRKWEAYAASKLANLLFSLELDRRARAAGARLTSVAAHPGYAVSNLALAGPRAARAPVTAWVMDLGHVFAQSTARGALPQLYAATQADVVGGELFGPRGPFELWGAPRRVRPAPRATDAALARQLWEVSVARTGVDFAALDPR